MTGAVDTALIELAERQHGLVARFQARDLGIRGPALHHRWNGPHWEIVTDQVLRRRGSPATTAQAVLAAVLDAGESAVLSHQSAGRWWGSTGCSLLPMHVVRTSRSSRSSTLAVVHTVRRLPSHWTTTLDGVPIVRPELLAMQLFAVCRPARAERLVETLWSMRLLSGASLRRFLDELGRSGRNGIAGLREYLDVRGDDYTPPATGLESRAIQILRDEGIEMRRQVDSGRATWTGRVDLRHATLPLIVEIQSERYHTALVDRLADRRRIQALEEDGFVVVELTDTQVWTRPSEAVDEVRAGMVRARRKRAA